MSADRKACIDVRGQDWSIDSDSRKSPVQETNSFSGVQTKLRFACDRMEQLVEKCASIGAWMFVDDSWMWLGRSGVCERKSIDW